MRVALYARYSSDLQSASSIEDQIAQLKTHVSNEGWQITSSYSDAAASGASIMRVGIQNLLLDAAHSKFDIVLTEALDRLSRNQSDIARIYEQLQFHGVQVITMSEGQINELHIGLKGTMNALFLKDLADKTRRGLKGRITAGKSAGGKSYGYDVPIKFNTSGDKITGDLTINEKQAQIINRIFFDYASGLSPRAIAHKLNSAAIKGPNGKAWGPSTINGNRKRGTGILNNELYIGRRIWNRLKYIKDPATGKRVSRLNPETEWIVNETPKLKIVEDELWQKVRLRQARLDNKHEDGSTVAFHEKQRPKFFWTGKVKCGCCGSSYVKISKDLLGCATSRNKGSSACSNRKTIKVEILEKHLLSGLEHHLMQPELFDEFVSVFTEELKSLRSHELNQQNDYTRRLDKINNQLEKAVDAILNGADVTMLKDRMHSLESEKAILDEKLLGLTEEPVVLLHPKMPRLYKEAVSTLSAKLQINKTDLDVINSIRELLKTVTLYPTEDGFDFDIEGELANILALSAEGNSKLLELTKKPSQFSLEGSDGFAKQIKMVAGVGFEPTTFRL